VPPDDFGPLTPRLYPPSLTTFPLLTILSFGVVKGVIRTRVGYCGGTKKNPTYYEIGDHTETIQIDFDPTVVSYDRLLEIFWSSHGTSYPPYSRQYMSAIFFHDGQQEKAEKSKLVKEKQTGSTVWTKILPFTEFTLAEDYHQKYYLRKIKDIKKILALNTDLDLVNSPIATKLNGYIQGHENTAEVETYINSIPKITDQSRQLLLSVIVKPYQGRKKVGGSKCQV